MQTALGCRSPVWRLYHEVGFTPDSLSRLLRLAGFQGIERGKWGRFVRVQRDFYGSLLVWQVIRSILKIWNVAETGSAGSGVFTRVFLIAGKKQ